MSTQEKKDISERVFDLLEATGLNWTVNKKPLISEDGLKTPSVGLFRNDNKQWLDTVKDRYNVLQNHEVAQAIIEATDQVNLVTSRGGQLKGGKHIYLQAQLPDEYVGKSNVKRMITGLNTHGGESAAFGSSDIVVVCENTFYMAFGELAKFRHTASIKERVDAFVKGIRESLGLEQRKIKVYKTMADVKLKDEIFAKIMEACFSVTPEMKVDDISTRQKNKLIAVTGAIEKEIQLEGATVWGLFNGVTRYTNHVAGQAKKAKTPEELLTYVMVGEGYETNLKAYTTIHDWLIEQKLLEPMEVVK